MKVLITTILYFTFTLSLQAAEFSCVIPDYDGVKGSEFKVELGLESDTFIGLDSDSFKRSPTKEDRMRWQVLEIGDFVVFIDAHKKMLEVKDREGKHLKEIPLTCKNVDEAEFEEISMINTPGKLEAMGGYYSENDRIADDGRSTDGAFFDSQSGENSSGNSVHK